MTAVAMVAGLLKSEALLVEPVLAAVLVAKQGLVAQLRARSSITANMVANIL
jgi:hypothetical protein